MSWPWIVMFVALWMVVIYALLIIAGMSRRLSLVEDGGFLTRDASAAERHAQLNAIAAGPRLGSSLPDFPEHPALSRDVSGEFGRIILLLSSTCGPCARLAEQLKQSDVVQARPELAEVDLVVVTDERGREQVESYANAVVIQKAGEVSARLGVRATPFAIAINRDGVVAVGLPGSAGDIADLALKTQARARDRARMRVSSCRRC